MFEDADTDAIIYHDEEIPYEWTSCMNYVDAAQNQLNASVTLQIV